MKKLILLILILSVGCIKKTVVNKSEPKVGSCDSIAEEYAQAVKEYDKLVNSLTEELEAKNERLDRLGHLNNNKQLRPLNEWKGYVDDGKPVNK